MNVRDKPRRIKLLVGFGMEIYNTHIEQSLLGIIIFSRVTAISDSSFELIISSQNKN
jgi:hypothetical protein